VPVLLTDLLVGAAVLVGLVGIVVPVLPGSLLILAAVLLWALEAASPAGWVVFSLVTVLLVVGSIVKYAVPGRRLRLDGVPRRTLLVGGLVGVLGFFVVPVVGLVVGFVAGVYLAEVQRVGGRLARSSTAAALRAVGVSLLIELTAGLVAAGTWLVGAVLV
jgi:uncharacterized protein YqgC (DUF456 family)